MSQVYFYCFSQISTQDILKIGVASLTPEVELSKLNIMRSSEEQFKIEFYIKQELSQIINEPQLVAKINALSTCFNNCKNCDNLSNNFYRVKKEIVFSLFDIMDGEITIFANGFKDFRQVEEISMFDGYTTPPLTRNIPKGHTRDFSKYFTDGLPIRFKNKDTQINGIYHSKSNYILGSTSYLSSMNKVFRSLNAFVNSSYIGDLGIDAWLYCEYLQDGKWISTKYL